MNDEDRKEAKKKFEQAINQARKALAGVGEGVSGLDMFLAHIYTQIMSKAMRKMEREMFLKLILRSQKKGMTESQILEMLGSADDFINDCLEVETVSVTQMEEDDD